MSRPAKFGNVYLALPESTTVEPVPPRGIVKAEKPQTPEELEEQPYIYRPSDPFQSAIDEAHAISSIKTNHKPWVKRTWFFLFVIGPLIYGELYALSLSMNQTGNEAIKSFLGANLLIIPIWLIYFAIWRRKASS